MDDVDGHPVGFVDARDADAALADAALERGRAHDDAGHAVDGEGRGAVVEVEPHEGEVARSQIRLDRGHVVRLRQKVGDVGHGHVEQGSEACLERVALAAECSLIHFARRHGS